MDELPSTRVKTDSDDFKLDIAVQNGQYLIAHDFLQAELAKPALATDLKLKLCLLYFRSGQWGKCSRSATAMVNDQPQSLDTRPLLNLLRDMSNVYYAGALKPALLTARSVAQTVLNNALVSTNPYIGVIAEMYLRAIKAVSKSSNWTNEDDCGGPWKSSGNRGWLDFVTLADQLCEKEAFYQAWLLLKILYTQPSIEVEMIGVLKNFIASCQVSKGNVSAQLAAVTASIWLCQLVRSKQSSDAAKPYLQEAKRLYDLLQDRLKAGTSIQLDYDYMCWVFGDSIGVTDRAKTLAKMAYRARDLGNLTRTDEMFTEATELALSGDMDSFTVWKREHDNLLSHKMENRRDLCGARSRQWRFQSSQELSQQLEWFARFEHQLKLDPEAPPFDDPAALSILEISRKNLYSKLQDKESEATSQTRIKELAKSLPEETTSIDAGYSLDFLGVKRTDGLDGIRVLLPTLKSISHTQGISNEDRQTLVGLVDLQKGSFTDEDVEIVARLHFDPRKLDVWTSTFAVLERILIASRLSVRDTQRGQYLLFRIQVSRITKAQGFEDVIREQQRLVTFLSSCSLDVQKETASQRFNGYLFLAKFQSFIAQAPQHHDDALNSCQQALQTQIQFPSLGRDAHRMGQLHVQFAEVIQRKRDQYGTPELESVLHHLDQAEHYFDIVRQDLTALPTEIGIQRQTRFADENIVVKQLQTTGVNALFWTVSNLPENTAAVEKLWEWIQRSKNRAMTDRMALTVRIPPVLIDRAVSGSARAKELTEEWLEVEAQLNFLKSVGGASPHEVFYLRKQRTSILDQMEDMSETQEIESLVRGRAMKFNDLMPFLRDLMSTRTNKTDPVLLVDWFTITLKTNEQRLYVLTARLESTEAEHPQLFLKEVRLSSDEVRNWIDNYLVKPSIETAMADGGDLIIQNLGTPQASQDLLNLAPLVMPLNDVLGNSDLIVLCPTANLHRIPLHAIPLPETEAKPAGCLLETHDVIYCHSLSSLQRCVSNFQETPKQSSRALGVFPLTVNYYDDEMREDFESTTSGELLQDSDVTADAVIAHSTSCSRVLFYGHVHDHSKSPLESHLCLYEEGPLHRDCSASETAGRILKASHILSGFKPAPNAHIDIIGCASGTPAQVGSDEYLGIVPALLCSGASSTTSTLWPIRSYKAVDYVRKVLELTAASVDNNGYVNMASCVRKASLWLMVQPGSTLADWAALVYHGYWKHVAPT